MARFTREQVQAVTLHVEPHPNIREREAHNPPLHTWLYASLHCKLEVRVPGDLNPGDRLVITVADQDGDPLARAYATVGPVTFEPIEDKHMGVIGTERVHKAKQTSEAHEAQTGLFDG